MSDSPPDKPLPPEEKPRRPLLRVRPLEIGVALALVAGAAITVYLSRRDAKTLLPPSALSRVETVPAAPIDENLATFNALAYHLYALKSDVGQYERVRANLANLATGNGLEPGIESADAALLDLCAECERFFLARKDLDLVRQAGLRENLFHTATAAGGMALGTAARYAVAGMSPLGLALAGGMAVSHAAGYVYANEKTEKQYQTAIDEARVGLNDQLARAEHQLVNLQNELETKYNWPPTAILTEAAFGVYADGLARFAEEQWDAALRAFERVGSLPGMAEAHFYAGLAWRSKGDPEKAVAELTEAIRRQPANFVYSRELVAAAYYHLAQIRLEQKDWNQAIGLINEAIRYVDGEADFHCLRGEILLEARHLPQAAEAFERALRLDESSARAAYGYAQAQADRGKTAEALDWLERASNEGKINLTEAARNPRLRSLIERPKFQAMTSLSIGRLIDWGPFADKAVLTNDNLFPLTNVAVVVRRKNAGADAEVSESAKKDRLEPGESLTVKGAISSGPKSRTEYFAYELACDQGEWSAKDVINAAEEK